VRILDTANMDSNAESIIEFLTLEMGVESPEAIPSLIRAIEILSETTKNPTQALDEAVALLEYGDNATNEAFLDAEDAPDETDDLDPID
jgi:hypothetical protein